MTHIEQKNIYKRFFQFISDKMASMPLFTKDDHLNIAKEGMEKLVCSKIYDLAFSPIHSDDPQRDDIVTRKMDLYKWIEPRHLDIPSHYNIDFLEYAGEQLLKINDYKAPRDKLICILNCCKLIYETKDEGISADDFFPLLLLTVIKSATPKLVSNVEYISGYRDSEKLKGESAYYYTNLKAAISFIEKKLDMNSLSIEREEFNRNIDSAVLEMTETLQNELELKQEEPETKKNFFDKPINLLNKLISPVQRQKLLNAFNINNQNPVSAPESTKNTPPELMGSRSLNASNASFESTLTEREREILDDYEMQLAIALSLSEDQSNSLSKANKSTDSLFAPLPVVEEIVSDDGGNLLDLEKNAIEKNRHILDDLEMKIDNESDYSSDESSHS